MSLSQVTCPSRILPLLAVVGHLYLHNCDFCSRCSRCSRAHRAGTADLFPFAILLRCGQYSFVGQERSCVDLTAVQHSDVIWQHRNDVRHCMLTSNAAGTVAAVTASCPYVVHERLKARVAGVGQCGCVPATPCQFSKTSLNAECGKHMQGCITQPTFSRRDKCSGRCLTTPPNTQVQPHHPGVAFSAPLSEEDTGSDVVTGQILPIAIIERS
jgi:hypothetical protein